MAVAKILSEDEQRELTQIINRNGGDPNDPGDVVTIWEQHKPYILRSRKDAK